MPLFLAFSCSQAAFSAWIPVSSFGIATALSVVSDEALELVLGSASMSVTVAESPQAARPKAAAPKIRARIVIYHLQLGISCVAGPILLALS